MSTVTVENVTRNMCATAAAETQPRPWLHLKTGTDFRWSVPSAMTLKQTTPQNFSAMSAG